MSDATRLALALMRLPHSRHPAPRRYFPVQTIAISVFDMRLDSTVAAKAGSSSLPYTQELRALMEQCALEHPLISVNKGIFGGVPHIKEMRLSVGDVLAQLYMLG